MKENKILNHIFTNSTSGEPYIKCSRCKVGKYLPLGIDLDLFLSTYTLIGDKCYCSDCYEKLKRLNKIVKEFKKYKKDNENKKINRPNKIKYYLNIAKTVATRSTCLRRNYGAIIVKDDCIIATGYNGSPRGTANCIDLNECRREKLNIPRGQCYEMCRAVHAEQNCIINAKRSDMIGSTLYLYGLNANNGSLIENLDSCQLCKKLIINSGIEQVIIPISETEYKIIKVVDWISKDETLTDKFGY